MVVKSSQNPPFLALLDIDNMCWFLVQSNNLSFKISLRFFKDHVFHYTLRASTNVGYLGGIGYNFNLLVHESILLDGDIDNMWKTS